jgi:hypothetical protein
MESILFTLVVWFSDGSMGWPEPGAVYPQVMAKGTVEIARRIDGTIVERRCVPGHCREQQVGFVSVFDPPAPPPTDQPRPR